jgi:hypothetical protein
LARPGLRSFLFEILRYVLGPQDPVNVRAFVEALVGNELQLGCIFHSHAMSDFTLEEGGILPERLQNGFLVLTEQRLYEHGRVAKVRRHPHFSDADKVRLEHVVMHVAALEQFAKDMANLLADAKQAHGTPFCGFLSAHQPISLPSRDRKAEAAGSSKRSKTEGGEAGASID